MQKRSKAWLLILIAVLVVLALAVCVILALNRGGIISFGTGNFTTRTVDIEWEFRNIKISTETENITFKQSPNGKCSVEFYEDEKVHHTAAVTNGTLAVGFEDTRKWYEKIILFSFGTPSITVYLPDASYGTLTIKESTGDIVIPEFVSFEAMEITVSTGDVDLFSSVEGRMSVTATTGDIRISRISAGELEIRTSTGKISAGSVKCDGDVTVSVSTGQTTLSEMTCRNLNSEGSTGELIMLKVEASGKITAERSTGDIRIERCDAEELYLKTSTGSVTGSLLTDKVFETRTGTGRVSVPDTSSGGKCKIVTSTGDISITIK
jgi:DUF4097 and DUF4098 domain-containing protein YvlB